MTSNLANLNPFIKRAMTKRPRWVYYAQSSPVVKEELYICIICHGRGLTGIAYPMNGGNARA